MAQPTAPETGTATMPTPSRTVYVLLRIAGYTWFKTYRTIEMLADTPSTATTRWLEHKQTELNFASLIGGLLASAVTGSLSWPNVQAAHWLVRACWYVSLSMVITSVLVAFQQVAGLGGILATRSTHGSLYHALLDKNGRPDIKTVFVLQVPVQLLSYSIFFYTLGLAVHVILPLGSKEWSDDSKIAIFYCVGLAVSVSLFMVGSHYSLQLLDTPDLRGKRGEGRGEGSGNGVESNLRMLAFMHRETSLEEAAGDGKKAETEQAVPGGMGGLREVME